jgi:hypothetical protein
MVMTGDLFAAAPEGTATVPPDYPTEEHAARIHHVRRPRYVEYDAGAAVLARLDWLFDHPKVARPPCSLIYADTNNGKTALAYKFGRDRNPREDSPEYGKRPVVYVHTPPFTDLTGFCDAVLRSLKAPHRSARLSAKWDHILQLLGAVGTRMLVLDEVNNLLIGKIDQRAMVMNGLKSLSNELRIPVVAMGTQDAVRVFQTDQQLGNRFEPMGLPRWTVSREYAVFIGRFAQGLELQQESQFRSRDIVGRIHGMAEGLTGETCKLLTMAAEVAIRSGREIIDMDTLDEIPWVAPSERRRVAK